MKTIKTWDEFNSVNEGIIDNIKSSLSKRFKPGELDDIVQGIIHDIKS